nr:LPXTG cell wall anchor domain-containing protein [Streptomyces sp. NBC_00830]
MEALDARDSERVAAARRLDQAQKDTEAALADKTAADEALAKATEEAGEGGDAKPSTTEPATSDLTPQGGASASPVSGSLAATGSSSATSQLALASGAALAIGAGAVFVARRRKAGSHA